LYRFNTKKYWTKCQILFALVFLSGNISYIPGVPERFEHIN
jgi:hypothetical protein